MKKLTLLLLGTLVLISCGATKEISIERMNFFKDYGGTSSKEKETIYFKSIDEESEFLEDWIEIIKNMSVMVSHYNRKIRKHEKKIIDSISNMTIYSQKEKDSLIQTYLKRSQIKPWTLLSTKDKEYMVHQVKNYKTTKWTALRNLFNLTRSKEARRISLPFISKNGKYAIIFIAQPGYQGLEVFRKVNGQWQYYFSSTLMIV